MLGHSMKKAKQYLRQAFHLNELINASQEEVDRLKALAISIGSPGLSQDRVQTSGQSDKIGNVVAKIADLEEKINREIDRYINLKREIRERINAVETDELRLILQKRYLNFTKWEQIAVDLGITFQWAHVLHKRALKEFLSKNPALDCN